MERRRFASRSKQTAAENRASIIDGLNEDSIDARLSLSASTVHTHIVRLHRKLDVHERTSLVVRVFVAHLICEREARKTAELVG